MCLRPRPWLHPLEQGLAPDWRGPARTVTLRAKPRAAREPAGQTATAAVDQALVNSLLSVRDHTPEYKAKMHRQEARTASISQLFVSIAAPAGLGLNRRRVHRAFQLLRSLPSRSRPSPTQGAGLGSSAKMGWVSISGRETGPESAPLLKERRRMERQASGFGRRSSPRSRPTPSSWMGNCVSATAAVVLTSGPSTPRCVRSDPTCRGWLSSRSTCLFESAVVIAILGREIAELEQV
jgi:hypothetical protein